ncbi:MAG: hypothetical protein US83_C0011G0034 [Candidatus Falkowbacteria bacterium GW2011_GWC2_38_22]|uniref:Uncharacterized protein n=1 Tax=Candidatus Falkowbacteria bacterium GW2011_GWE1_38_31 TaxID=1618638 RepID=A0A0G0MY48_9BACT|nr:MAG: hypothetical protein US73_C0009G0034 [Candidatus Falkowbacteria bacterium GW2011_GWF2_38_1205]KKQ60916.1 MAG: hypothetical protein US83_C0011G0034 [Candidatus Falkowbacteria bacterium GW2011_GWC2_38_22]KKQ63034.1 MAG: hypothetical protein US84_C0009G0034 [Candidatus Falkowbacteria bacterium GW2011_GWF1_38_22]KKQ65056.1 MAG: hypothetical protein US87_C0009G0034 [Candidatus Falkowbacteria bacterium GW2011_GWE2_38_254]KKQ69831.1 MAG: hypothetical protein US91_C0009G0034 [Candidatus Falkowb
MSRKMIFNNKYATIKTANYYGYRIIINLKNLYGLF